MLYNLHSLGCVTGLGQVCVKKKKAALFKPNNRSPDMTTTKPEKKQKNKVYSCEGSRRGRPTGLWPTTSYFCRLQCGISPRNTNKTGLQNMTLPSHGCGRQDKQDISTKTATMPTPYECSYIHGGVFLLGDSINMSHCNIELLQGDTPGKLMYTLFSSSRYWDDTDSWQAVAMMDRGLVASVHPSWMT